LKARGVRYIYRRVVTPAPGRNPASLDCLLVKSRRTEVLLRAGHGGVRRQEPVGKGGQNPIEAGAMGKAMVFGPNMQNFAAIAEIFVQGNRRRCRSGTRRTSRKTWARC